MAKNKNSGDKSRPGKPQKTRKTIRTEKVCFQCGIKVDPNATECPACGASGETSPLWILKITIGFILGFLLWLLFWR